jgi:hypothetical protein
MPRHYPAELRRPDLRANARWRKDLVAQLGIAQVTLYKGRRQALTDASQRPLRESDRNVRFCVEDRLVSRQGARYCSTRYRDRAKRRRKRSR